MRHLVSNLILRIATVSYYQRLPIIGGGLPHTPQNLYLTFVIDTKRMIMYKQNRALESNIWL